MISKKLASERTKLKIEWEKGEDKIISKSNKSTKKPNGFTDLKFIWLKQKKQDVNEKMCSSKRVKKNMFELIAKKKEKQKMLEQNEI